MPISRAGKKRKNSEQQSGFTLVEILVVLLIFGLMTSMVVLNLPKQKNPLYKQGRQIATQLEYAAQTSLVNHKTLGVRFTKDGYEIVEYKLKGWESVASYNFTQGNIPQFKLIKNGVKVNLKQAVSNNEPLILYGTTGLATPFRLFLEGVDSEMELIGARDGIIAIKYGNFTDE